MRTTLDLNESLMSKALEITGLKTKKSVIEAGLKELISKNNTDAFIKSHGSMDLDISTEDIRMWREKEESIIEPGSVNEPSVS